MIAVVLFTGSLSFRGEKPPMAYLRWMFLKTISIWGWDSMKGRKRPYFSSNKRSNLAALAWTFHVLVEVVKWEDVSVRRVVNSSMSCWVVNRRDGMLESVGGWLLEDVTVVPSRSNSTSSSSSS
eukprot:CAMPEP_0201973246 /NCGR_PEP_ID=MMETSP0904-20121228/45473_1 /ASSEMBLY_ACC=CAM_ASM_000553 /TAXON_ID=420261 /ORGANISM="Thalassiosira antarctica, Strain CCMP982" /LENGTH=123 /DNA_ID=CAMNT_0048523357 /DNA_START=12 /DNA_END=380 /DNA_ORIENTATION=-